MHVDFTPLEVALANAVLPNLLNFVGSAAILILTPYAVKWFGADRTKTMTETFDHLMRQSIAGAVPEMVGQIQAHGWTPEIQNELARLAAQKAVAANAKLATWAQTNSTTLEQKALNRLASHPDVQAAVAGVSPPDPSNDNAPASAAA